ncbi:MAG: alpha/beta fold hydrolase [Saprospiraceae bacterium]|nr:alpha/beta fold hydrolase [Saprospiraceae bacterium]
MRPLFIYIFLFFLVSHSLIAQEIINFRLQDGEMIKGKLSLPKPSDSISHIVLYIHGTGPNTYLNKRGNNNQNFNYYDMFANEFNKAGIGFLSYNRRGVTMSETPPMYDQVDSVKFLKYSPHAEAKDVEAIIRQLKKYRNLQKTKIILLGWSEGTIIASMIAERKIIDIDALILCGYVNENLFDVIKWQLNGGSSMINVCQCFDTDDNKYVDRSEYESKETVATYCREKLFGGADFSLLDKSPDSILDARDFKIQTESYYNMLMEKTKEGDNNWIWNNYFRITSQWLKQHFVLEANKTRMLRLEIPIYIFHGTNDANTAVEGVYDIKKRFESTGKTNLKCEVFEKHDHDLNFSTWLEKKELPAGLKAIFEQAKNIIN